MGRASEGKKAAKEKKFGKKGGKRKHTDELEFPSSKKRHAKEQEDPERTSVQLVGKMKASQLKGVDDFFDAVGAGVEIEADGDEVEDEAADEIEGDFEASEEESEEDDEDEDKEDEEDEEDEDDDEDDEDPEKMRKSIARHKLQLASLKKSDPEFYEFMKQEGEEELGFGADVDTTDLETTDLQSSEDESDDDNDDEDEAAPAGEKVGHATSAAEDAMERARANKKHLTMQTLSQWERDAKDGKLGAVNSILRAFDAATVLLETPEGKADKAAIGRVRRCKYKIESGEVFDALLVSATRDMPAILMDDVLERPEDQVPRDGTSARGSVWKPQKHKNWKAMAKPIGQYCANLVTLLRATTEAEMTSWVLRAVGSALPLLTVTPKLARSVLKTTLAQWATGDESVRARSFFVIRGLSISSPKKLLPLAMKGAYLTYIRHTKTSNPTALPRINFFVACITDLFGLDMEMAYDNAFLSIRQLAVTLRNALTAKAGATSNTVCCWPFVNALRCWGQVISAPLAT